MEVTNRRCTVAYVRFWNILSPCMLPEKRRIVDWKKCEAGKY
jgi:hypothetical protein